MSITKVGWARCLICVRFNRSLDARVRFHLGKKLETVRGQLWILSMGRLTLKRMEGGWIYHWIDFSNMHKVIVKPTEWSNSTGELAHWKLHPMDQDSMPRRTWLSSAWGYTWVGKICTLNKGSIIQLNHDRLGSEYWPGYYMHQQSKGYPIL